MDQRKVGALLYIAVFIFAGVIIYASISLAIVDIALTLIPLMIFLLLTVIKQRRK